MLFLDDVYWRDEGRISLDAVLLAVALLALILVTVHPVGTKVSAVENATRLAIFVHVLVTVPLVVVCLLKGKPYTALVGPFAMIFAIVGAVRVAKPASPWAQPLPGSTRHDGQGRRPLPRRSAGGPTAPACARRDRRRLSTPRPSPPTVPTARRRRRPGRCRPTWHDRPPSPGPEVVSSWCD